MVIYDRLWNRKNYFEFTAPLNFEGGALRAGNSIEYKNANKRHISVAAKCNKYFEFAALDFPHSIARKAGLLK